MNRLQKKCLIATAGFHLLLIVILIVGPGFFTEKPRPDDTPVLQEIPDTVVEAALNSGVANAQPPPPAPAIVTPPTPVQPPTPTPPAPVPTPQPPTPAPQPVSTPPVVKPVEPVDPTPVTPMPDDTKPVEHKHAKPVKPVEHKAKPPTERKISLVAVTRTATTDSSAQNAQAAAQREARRAAREQANAINNAINNLSKNFSTATKVEMPGTGSVSYASYAAIIKTKYTQAWTPPNNAANDEANVKVKVTIGSDGTVISAHIIDASGDSSVDDSVQRTLDRVDFIAPFPDGATEKTKTFIINFNLKAKQMLG